jgi:invasion protein IalB
MISRSLAAVSAAAFLLLGMPALAQNQQQAAQGRGGLVANETKAVGDWTVRCFPIKSPSPCDMFELLADKKNGRRVMSLSIAYVPQQDRHAIQIALPLGVALGKGVQLTSDSFNSPLMRYRRCDRAGCYVEGLIDNKSVDALAASQGGAKVKFSAYGGRDYALPFSLSGFSEARNTMMELARSHVKLAGNTAPAAPAPTAPASPQ